VREQVFFAATASVSVPMRVVVLVRLAVRRYLARVHVQTVLALLRETDQERYEVVHNRVRYVFGQTFLFHAIFVQRGHEVRQRLRHPELDFEFPARKYQRVLMRYGYEAEQSRRFRRTPLAARAVRQRHHDGLQLFADDLELAHALEFHRFSGQILFGRHRIGEYVQQERAAVGRVYAKRHDVSQHRLHDETLQAHAVVSVPFALVKFQIIVEYQVELHVSRYCYSHRGCSRRVREHDRFCVRVRKVEAVSEEQRPDER